MANRQSLLILIMIVFLGLIGGYFYYSTMVVPAIEPVASAPVQRDDLKSFENLKIDYGILTNKKFQSLEIFGESPVNPGATGKKDIFLPF